MGKKGYIDASFLITVNLLCARLIDASCGKSTPPLLNDITIREPTLFSDYWTTGDGLILSDRELNAGWYRAVFNGRQYLMADSNDNPETTSCNTLYPIYLKDKHPSLDELSEKPVTRAACVLDYDQTCSLEINVMIRKCDKEVQYYLKSTLIYSAYCFGEGDIIYDTDVPPPKNVNLGNIQAIPELRFKESPGRRYKFLYHPYIQFRCAFSNSSDHFYNVQWKVAGNPIASLGPSKNMDDLYLKEEQFKDVPLGYMVQCSVTVSSAMFGQQTQPVYSNNFYAGVKIYNSTVLLRKGSSAKISMSPTLPIGCRHIDKHYKACKDELQIRNADPHECFQEGINNVVKTDYSKCSEFIETLHKEANWDPNKLRVYHFTIVTSDMDYEDKTNFDLKLKFSDNMRHTFWKNKVLPDVKVVVVDAKEYKEKVCYSHIDPHMRTADGYYYEQQQEGDFILYYNEKYNIEVQETTKTCYSSPTCACGVSIRAGKDVFVINRCGEVYFLGFTQCEDGGILQVVQTKSDEYTIFTPIGTKITIKLQSKPHLNIDIKMAPKDVNNVRGLCGKFDGDMTNDLVHSDGKISPLDSGEMIRHGKQYRDFANSWRVTKEKVYSRQKRTLDSWAKLNGLYCVCQEGKSDVSAEALCSSTQYFDCPMKKSITETKCHIHKYRKKRSPVAHEKEMDRLFALMEPIKDHDIIKRQTQENIINEEQATQTCKKMISGSLAFTSYANMTASENQNAVISQCVFDLLATNDISFAEVHKDSVNTIVKGMMNEVPTYVETNKQEVQVFLKNSCSGNCSNRGNCSEDGECLCDQYYHGAICDIDERIPPIVMDIEGGGVCDVGEGDECRCFYLRGDNFLKSMKCKIVTSEITISGEITNITLETVDGGYEDIFTGVCCIQEGNSFSEDMFLREHDISISSDGVHYGDNKTMYVFDSTCQKLDSLSTGKPSFTLKNEFCFIKQACIEDTYAFLSNNDTCLSCNTSVSVNDWTETNIEICIPTTTTTTTTTTSATTTTTAKARKACTSTATTAPEIATQSIANASTETPSLKEVELTTESTINITTQTHQPETTSTTKRCKIKRLLRLKQRKNRLSLRNKKQKLKTKRLMKQINRLKILLQRFQKKRKNNTEQTTTKTVMKTAMNVSKPAVLRSINEELPNTYANKSERHNSSDNISDEVTTVKTTPIPIGTSGWTNSNDQLPKKKANKTRHLQSYDNEDNEITTEKTTPNLSGTSGEEINEKNPNDH